MDSDSFNEVELFRKLVRDYSVRRERAHKGIDEDAWQAEHRIWTPWVFRYEILKTNGENGHFSIAHEYDENCHNIAAN